MISSRTETVEGIEFHSVELPCCDATDLLAEMLAVIAPGAGQFGAGATQGEAVGQICKELVGGRLTNYLVRILASTTMIIRGDGAGNFTLNTRDALNKAFAGRKRYLPFAVKLAVEVSFKDFLGGLGLIGIDLSKASPFGDSNPSTTATG